MTAEEFKRTAELLRNYTHSSWPDYLGLAAELEAEADAPAREDLLAALKSAEFKLSGLVAVDGVFETLEIVRAATRRHEFRR